MNMTAFGYYNSKLIKKIGVEPVLGLAAQPPRLFYHSEFVPNHNYWKCLKYSNYADEQDRENFCLQKLNVNTVIAEENNFKNNNNFDCLPFVFKETPRNIFKSSQYKVDVCRKK